MFRKILTSVLMLAAVAAVPVMMTGCGPKECTHCRQTTETNKPVEQHEVVE